MTATVQHFHHHGQRDDLVIVERPGGLDSGVVRVRDTDGIEFPELASALEPWDGGVR